MKKKTIYLFLCILWMIVIFMFSNQPADDSQGMSNTVIELIDQIFHINIMSEQGWLFDTVSFIVRKAAHMSEYALLAMLFGAFFKECGYRKYLWISLVCVILYASSDEVHQLFIPGRTGKLQDVGIDTLGGMCGMLVQQGYWYWRRVRENRKMK